MPSPITEPEKAVDTLAEYAPIVPNLSPCPPLIVLPEAPVAKTAPPPVGSDDSDAGDRGDVTKDEERRNKLRKLNADLADGLIAPDMYCLIVAKFY